MSHWAIRRNHIVSRVRVDDSHSDIACVINDRSCAQLLRYAQMGEEVERVIDRVMGGMVEDSDAVELVTDCVKQCIRDTASSNAHMLCNRLADEVP